MKTLDIFASDEDVNSPPDRIDLVLAKLDTGGFQWCFKIDGQSSCDCVFNTFEDAKNHVGCGHYTDFRFGA